MSQSNTQLQQIDGLINKENYDKAIALSEKYTQNNPNDAAGWYYLGTAYSLKGNYTKATESFQKALAINPNETKVLYALAKQAYNNNSYDEALQYCRQVTKLDPDYIDNILLLGHISFDQDDFKSAIKFYLEAENKQPNTDAKLSLLEAYFMTNNLLKMEVIFIDLEQAELTAFQKMRKDYIYASFCIEKATENWKESVDEAGKTFFYPEDIDDIEQAEQYLEQAKQTNPTRDKQIQRIEQISQTITFYRNKMGLSNDPVVIHNNWFNSLSENDRVSYEYLEKVFNMWPVGSVEDGIEYRWPQTVVDITESDKVLKTIAKRNITDQQVKNRYKELREVTDHKLKTIPNYLRRYLIATGLSLLAIITLIILIHIGRFKKPDFTFNQTDWVTTNNAELMYNAFAGELHQEKKLYKPLANGTQLTPLARQGRWWMQVKTPDGNIGYIYYRNIKGAGQAVAKEKCALYSSYKNKIVSDSLKPDQPVTILQYFNEGKEEHGNIAQIKTEDGKRGYVPYYKLNLPFKKDVPEISQKFIYPTTYINIEKAVGDSLPTLEKRYGPVTSIITLKGKTTAFFNQIELIHEGKKYSGVFFDLDNKGTILNFKLDDTKKVKLYDRLPLADRLKQHELFGLISFSFYKSENNHFAWWDKFKGLHWSTKILGWIIQFFVGLTLILLFFSLPRLIVNPIIISIDNIRFLGNGLVKSLTFLVYIFATYLFFVWIALLMSQFLIPFILCLITFSFWYHLHNKNIDYNRCPSCHAMNVAISHGSTYQGRSSSVNWGTYDVYKGTTETSTQITRHYERRSTKTTTYTDHYTDHQECKHCGYNWNVSRDESAGSTTRNY